MSYVKVYNTLYIALNKYLQKLKYTDKDIHTLIAAMVSIVMTYENDKAKTLQKMVRG